MAVRFDRLYMCPLGHLDYSQGTITPEYLRSKQRTIASVLQTFADKGILDDVSAFQLQIQHYSYFVQKRLLTQSERAIYYRLGFAIHNFTHILSITCPSAPSAELVHFFITYTEAADVLPYFFNDMKEHPEE